MEINAHNLGILTTAVNTRFKTAFNATAKDKYNEIALTVPMATGVINYPFLEQLGGMREWIDDRKVKKIAANKLVVSARKFEETVAIERDAIEDDTYGMYMPIIDNLGVQAANLRGDLIEEVLTNASSAKWVDGANFFGTSRKYGKETISNYTTSALSKSTLKTAYDAMRNYKGHGGTKLKVRPRYLVIGSALRWTAKALVENPLEEVNGAALPNDTYNLVQILETDADLGNKWFLIGETGIGKAIGYFDRIAPSMVRKDKETDDNVFYQDEYVYGTRARAESAWLFPHLAYFGNVS